ncbi:MAG: hypothetical protein QXH07_07020 [Thermoplasmata archaeon]
MADLEELKQKYPKVWQELQDTDFFLKYVKLKEKQKQLIEKIRTQKEKERKRRARALIILAELCLQDKALLEQITFKLNEWQEHFKVKESKQAIDLSRYIKAEIEWIKQKAQESEKK